MLKFIIIFYSLLLNLNTIYLINMYTEFSKRNISYFVSSYIKTPNNTICSLCIGIYLDKTKQEQGR